MVATISKVNSLTLHNKYNKTYRKITKNDEKKHFFFKKMLFFCAYLEQIFKLQYLFQKQVYKPNKQH